MSELEQLTGDRNGYKFVHEVAYVRQTTSGKTIICPIRRINSETVRDKTFTKGGRIVDLE